MMKPALLKLIMFTWLAAVGCGQEPHPEWSALEVLRNDQVEVRLHYRPQASLSDEDWLKLEFTRLAGNDVKLTNGNYRIESERFAADGKTLVSSGGLASGGIYDLSTDRRLMQAEHPSRYSSALLGLAPQGGLIVKARLYLNLELSNGSRASTPTEGVPFTFKWNRPDEAGFRRMRHRLQVLLNEPQGESNRCHSYILGALLGIPEVSNDLPLAGLLAAIDRRSGGFDGREALVDHLKQRSSDIIEIRNHYLSRLESKDSRACEDLLRAPWLWDRRMIKPLVAMHELPNTPPFTELMVLSAHSADWADDRELPHRLSAPLLEHYGMFLKRTPEQLIQSKQLDYWAMYASDLGHTRDRDALPFLIPFLSCKEAFMDPRLAKPNAPGQLPYPYRACDAALNAILTILDGDTTKAFQAAGIPEPTPTGIWTLGRTPSIDEMTTLRDKMILTLKTRLTSEGGKQQK